MTKQTIWGLILCSILAAGCDQMEARWPGGGGGATPAEQAQDQAPSGDIKAQNPALARDYLGNAFVASARVHKSVGQANYYAARTDLAAVRRQLQLAGQWASVDQKRKLNSLEALTIEVESRIERQPNDTISASSTLLKELFNTYEQYAMATPAGGGGGPQAAPPAQSEPEPLPPLPAPAAPAAQPEPHPALLKGDQDELNENGHVDLVR